MRSHFNTYDVAAIARKKHRQYSHEYLKYGYVPSFADENIHLRLVCEKTFSNDAMKPAIMTDHLEGIHSDNTKILNV